MFNDLLSYNELEEACADAFGFGDVTMLRDFGPLKKGQKIKQLWFMTETGIVRAWIYDIESRNPIEFKFTLQALSQ